jgi:hypothetical protein
VVAQERGPLAVERDVGQLGQRLLDRRRVLAGQRQVDPLHDVEVEDEVELVAVLVAEERPLVLGRQVDLAQQDAFPVAPFEEGADVLEVAVGIDRRGAVDAVELDEERHGVDPETADPELEPEPDDAGDLLADRRVGDVEVGLGLVEAVEVVLPDLAVVGPHPALIAGEGLGEVGVLGLLVDPDVPVPVGGVGVGPSRLEPRVLVGRVVDDEVDDHPHAPVAGGAHRLHELAERPQPRVDVVEVADVVAVILVGCGVEGHQPEG